MFDSEELDRLGRLLDNGLISKEEFDQEKQKLFQETKTIRCQYCKEEIQNGSIKCKHCGESVASDKVIDSSLLDLGTMSQSTRENIKCFKTAIWTKCAECSYNGFMGVVKKHVSWWEDPSIFALVVLIKYFVFSPTLLIIWNKYQNIILIYFIVVGIRRYFWPSYLVKCPSCEKKQVRSKDIS